MWMRQPTCAPPAAPPPPPPAICQSESVSSCRAREEERGGGGGGGRWAAGAPCRAPRGRASSRAASPTAPRAPRTPWRCLQHPPGPTPARPWMCTGSWSCSFLPRPPQRWVIFSFILFKRVWKLLTLFVVCNRTPQKKRAIYIYTLTSKKISTAKRKIILKVHQKTRVLYSAHI